MKRFSLFALSLAAALTLSACGMIEGLTVAEDPVAEDSAVAETDGSQLDEQQNGDEDAAGNDPAEPEEEQLEWVKFSDPRIDFSFKTPETWSVEDNGGDPPRGIFEFEIYDDEGERQLDYLSALYSTWTGEDCPAGAPQMNITEYDVTALDLYDGAADENLRFAYRVADDGAGLFIGSVALLSGPADQGGSCVVSNNSRAYGPVMFADMRRINFVNPERFDREFDSLEEAEEFMQTELYKNLKAIILSLETN